jgi:hypothetical protein
MRPSAYLPDPARLASLVAAVVGEPVVARGAVAAAPAPTPVAPAPRDAWAFVDAMSPPADGPIEARLQRFVEELRDQSGAHAVFVADAEGLELAFVGAEPALIALLGEFTGVRRRVANAAAARRPLAMSVAVRDDQWLQVFWLDEDSSSPAVALVHHSQIAPSVAARLRSIVHSILGNLR